jgi:hypothetical protein
MSATNNPQGFTPVYHPSGVTIPVNIYQPSTLPASAIYRGDPVTMSGGTDVITVATTSGVVVGVFAGCEYINAAGVPVESPYWPGSTVGASSTNLKFFVYDDPFTTFEVQANGSLTAADIGGSADSVAIGTGSTASGVSLGVISSTITGAAAVKQWRIVGLGGSTTNVWGDAYTVVRVKIGQSQLITTPNSI